jgi:nitroreductase
MSASGATRRHWYDRGWGLALSLFENTRDCDGLRSVPDRSKPGAACSDPPGGSDMLTGEVLRRRCATVRLGSGGGTELATLVTVVAQADRPRQHDRAIGGGLAGLRLFVVLYDDHAPEHPGGVYEVVSSPSWSLVSAVAGDELRRLMHPILMGQGATDGASATFVLVLDIPRQQSLIAGDRGLVDAYIDSGRLGQRLVLSATAEGLRTHQTPAVRDPLIEQLLGLRAETAHVVYTISVG